MGVMRIKGDLTGYVALMGRGGCFFEEKVPKLIFYY